MQLAQTTSLPAMAVHVANQPPAKVGVTGARGSPMTWLKLVAAACAGLGSYIFPCNQMLTRPRKALGADFPAPEVADIDGIYFSCNRLFAISGLSSSRQEIDASVGTYDARRAESLL